MKQYLATVLVALCGSVSAEAPFRFPAATNGKAELKHIDHIPVLLVVGATSTNGAAASAVVAVPAALSVGDVVLTVVAIEASVDATVFLLERASDGARASVKVLGRVADGAWIVVGSTVTVSVIASGVILSAAGEVLAFVPNALGRALLFNERLS